MEEGTGFDNSLLLIKFSPPLHPPYMCAVNTKKKALFGLIMKKKIGINNIYCMCSIAD